MTSKVNNIEMINAEVNFESIDRELVIEDIYTFLTGMSVENALYTLKRVKEKVKRTIVTSNTEEDGN